MTSTILDWLREAGLPLGPFAAPVTLQARHRGRRLHLGTDCPQYQQMSPRRWPFPVAVALPELDPRAHLCSWCAPRLDAALVSPRLPGGDERARYLRLAREVLTLREQATGQCAAVRAATGLPSRAEVSALGTSRWALTELAREVAAETDGAPALVPVVAGLLDQVRAALGSVRTSWGTPAGRRAACRVAAVDRQQEHYATLRTGVTFASRDPVRTKAALSRPVWAYEAARRGYQAWCLAVAEPRELPACRQAALEAAAAHLDRTLAVEHLHRLLEGVPTGAAGVDLAAHARASLHAFCAQTVGDLVDFWEQDLNRRIAGEDGPEGPDAQQCAGDADTLLVVLVRGLRSRPELLASPLLAAAAGAELLAVPAPVLRATHQAGYPLEAVVGAAHLPPEVLHSALRLALAGTPLGTAVEAAQAIHHEALAPAP